MEKKTHTKCICKSYTGILKYTLRIANQNICALLNNKKTNKAIYIMQFHVKKFKDFHEFILSRVLANLKPCCMNHSTWNSD